MIAHAAEKYLGSKLKGGFKAEGAVVPFARAEGQVTFLGEIRRHGAKVVEHLFFNPGIELVAGVQGKQVLSGKQHRSARGAYRTVMSALDVGIGKARAPGCQPVGIGCADVGISCTAHGVGSLVVREDEKNIRPVGALQLLTAGAQAQAQEREAQKVERAGNGFSQ